MHHPSKDRAQGATSSTLCPSGTASPQAPDHEPREPSEFSEGDLAVPATWATLVAIALRAAAGCDKSFADLMGRVEAAARKIIEPQLSAAVRRTLDVDDVLQEVWLSLHKALPSFQSRGRDSFLPWFCTIVRRRVQDVLRGFYRRDAALPDHFERLVKHDADDRPCPDEFFARQELARHVTKEVDQLPDHARETASLVLIQGRSHREAAEILQDSCGAVRLRAKRAGEGIRRKLA